MGYDTMLKIIQHISDALDYAHKNGVIHRDIKPSNIMISREGKAILTDFGLALDVAEGTQGEIFGSPHYISPEQAINSAQVKPQSDIYSLGVVLHEILTGIVPYHDGTAFEIAMAQINDPLPDPLTVNPKLHQAFIPILQKSMEKDTAARYQNCRQLMQDLRAAVKEAERANQIPKASSPKATRPEERIALRVSPLPPADADEQTKPPTLIARMPTMSDAVKLGDKNYESQSLSELERAKAARRRSRLPVIIAAVLLVIISFAAYGVLTQFNVNLPRVPSFAADTKTNGAVEGRIVAVTGRTLKIYDMSVALDINEPLLDEPELTGKMIRLEGHYNITETGIEFTHVESILVDNEPLSEDEE
jgi:serine/threonine protein kinase